MRGHPQHRAPDGLAIARHLLHHAVVQGEHPVRQRQHLVEVAAVHEHREPGVARGTQCLMHCRRRAKVEPTRGVLHDERARRVVERAREHELLLVAAGERAGASVRTRGTHVAFAEERGRARGQCVPRHATTARARVAQRQVLRERRIEQQRVAVPVLGHEGDVVRCAQLATRDGQQAGDGAQQLVLPRALDRREAHDFADAYREARIAHARDTLGILHHQAVRVQHVVVRSGRIVMRGNAGTHFLLHLHRPVARPEHRVGEGCFRELRRRTSDHACAPPQHREVVGDGQRIAQLVRDQHDGMRRVGLDEGAHPPQQPLCFVGGEHGRGFVENEHAHIARERLHDFAALLRAHRQVAHARAGIEHEPGALTDATHGGGHLVGAIATGCAERDVLGHGHRRHERKVLVHHAQAAGHRVARRERCRHRRTVERNGAAVGAQQSERDAHERGLPRPVLAEQCVHGARSHREGHVVERTHRPEALANAAQRERRGTLGRCRWRGHARDQSPVGRSTKACGRPNCASSHPPSACTPSVSVA